MLTAGEAASLVRNGQAAGGQHARAGLRSQLGGWHDAFVRETGQQDVAYEQAWWQQEQGLLATGLLTFSNPAKGASDIVTRRCRPSLSGTAHLSTGCPSPNQREDVAGRHSDSTRELIAMMIARRAAGTFRRTCVRSHVTRTLTCTVQQMT